MHGATTAGSSTSRSSSTTWSKRTSGSAATESKTFPRARSGLPDWNPNAAGIRAFYFRDPDGHAVELLEYLTPRDGRPYPVDARANDLVHWHTIVTTSSPEAVYRALLAGRYPLVSPRVVTLPDGPLGSREAFLARDPDGHALQFRAR